VLFQQYILNEFKYKKYLRVDNFVIHYYNIKMNKDEIIENLYKNQLKDIDNRYRLNEKDIIRLSSYLLGDPFSSNECCGWIGAVSKSTHNSKYINFWFNKKKQSLHRILYYNYIGNLPNSKYLRFTCKNTEMRGICCNINHLELINKNEYNNHDNVIKTNEKKKQNTPTKFTIYFDDSDSSKSVSNLSNSIDSDSMDV
jgi:hypothetical protein